MGDLPQLVLFNYNLNDLSDDEIKNLPSNIEIHTENDKSKNVWEEIIKDSFEQEFEYDDSITSKVGYSKEGIFFASVDGEDLATTAVIEDPSYADAGYIHMVGCKKSARGMKLGYYCVLSALLYIKSKGYEKAVLKTDDFRIPAIKTYLKLGFTPYFEHESHEQRWKDIMEKLK